MKSSILLWVFFGILKYSLSLMIYQDLPDQDSQHPVDATV